jgi:RNA polymerase sigma-70 factor (ECF subfamily)
MAMPLVTTTQWRKMEQDDLTLVLAAQQDPAEFAALYARYIQPVYRYLYSRVDNPADAEDLTAQTFLAALEALPRYHHRGHLPAWLFAIARSKAMDFFRRRPTLPLEEHPDDRPDLLAQASRSDEIQRLAGLIRSLDPGERELIRLRFVAGLSFAEMAALLKKKEDTVKKSLYRLLARLQSQLEANHE